MGFFITYEASLAVVRTIAAARRCSDFDVLDGVIKGHGFCQLSWLFDDSLRFSTGGCFRGACRFLGAVSLALWQLLSTALPPKLLRRQYPKIERRLIFSFVSNPLVAHLNKGLIGPTVLLFVLPHRKRNVVSTRQQSRRLQLMRSGRRSRSFVTGLLGDHFLDLADLKLMGILDVYQLLLMAAREVFDRLH